MIRPVFLFFHLCKDITGSRLESLEALVCKYSYFGCFPCSAFGIIIADMKIEELKRAQVGYLNTPLEYIPHSMSLSENKCMLPEP